MALLVSETLKNNGKEGIKVAIAPLITDAPIILITTLILSKASDHNIVSGFISIAGSMFLSYLAYNNIFLRNFEPGNVERSKSLEKGILVNFLNPNPYLFWFTVGAPTLLKSLKEAGVYAAIFFLIGFYVFLVGSQIMIAIIVERYRNFLESRIYEYLIRFTGILLLFFALLFLRDGLRFFLNLN